MIILNTILLVIKDAKELADVVDYKLVMTMGTAVSGALIGGCITIWYKSKEINNLSKGLELQSKNLDLQIQLFEENKTNNELKMKAELVRLEDLNRQYQLNLQKHDFEHLSKVLDFAGDPSEKVKMLKDFSNVLNKYKPNLPNGIIDLSEYEEYIINHVFYELDFIDLEIDKLLQEYPTVFNTLHDDFKSVRGDAKYLLSSAADIASRQDSDGNYSYDRHEYIIAQLAPSLLKLHKFFNDLLTKMQQEFLELDTLKKEYIRSQFKNRVEEQNK
jgi:hypothetical protein